MKTANILPMIDDSDTIAVIRYDGDPDVFTALAWAYAIEQEEDYTLLPPEPSLYRCNPTPLDSEFSFWLGEPEKRGPGVWLGARVNRGVYRQPAYMREFIARLPRD